MEEKVKKELQKKKEQLMNEFEENRKKATFFMDKKNQIDGSLNILVNKGSLISAKVAAIDDMLKE